MVKKMNLIVLLLILISTSNFAQFNFRVAFPNLSFSDPLDLQNAGDGTNRIFVVEQDGRIRVFPNDENAQSTKLFLDITDRVTSGGETGLLGLAFHPNYESNGYFYVNYTAPSPLRTVISRFKVSSTNPDSADKNSEQILVTYNQPYSNHNGGAVVFGPDGYLYIGSGDGGSGGDPQNNAQNITSLLGKILRIDVDNPQAPLNYGIPPDNPFVDSTNVNIRKEIYAWGMRNPWRISFDPVTDSLWCGDVGQGDWEEIDIIKKGKNYGWRCYEGNHTYNTSGCNGTYEFPVWEYSHSLGYSITGGFVYRGINVPELVGKYIYGDYVSRRVWSLEYDGINPPTNTQITTSSGSITSFGVDENNELYLVSFNGKIYSFIPTIVPVELISFSAVVVDGKVKLDWFTATEINNSGFSIERATDTSEFQELIFIGGHGTTNNKNEYTYLDESVKSGIYHYRLKQINFDGSYEYLKTVSVDLGMPDGFMLGQNYPNPFNPTTTIEFQIPISEFVSLKVYDSLGREIRVLINEEKKAGFYKVDFDASDLTSGIYFYKLSTDNFSAARKMTILK
ncbi:MAG: T9SS type A sorting domain-containing protein [Ignavibacteriota bacterium]|nr:T9SS C-terminal target domain-containing protein [Ignavibacteriota bacterium]MCZ2270299.1 PQQ-dependent sugar dehydrogenase [Ignavibacteriales bacterium]QKJ99747.1 MAG: T9SS type A sorting domain-containing protein [Ignavibacteriota bacterium]HMN17434.1 PQQ-dependent sugar dehydrogenase [Ignavibacteriaceae bacterium]HOJ05939.1 PQQ-dependent sugar dehydrogenase [Ignavibacteriaceae bacterium]